MAVPGIEGGTDVEMRARQHPAGGGKGGITCDPNRLSRRELEALRRGDRRRDRAREGHPRARREHGRTGHGVGDGHLQHAHRACDDEHRHRETTGTRWLAWPSRGDRPRRKVIVAGSARVLLVRARGQRAARDEDARGVRGDAADGAAVPRGHAHCRLHGRDQSRGDGDTDARHVRVGAHSVRRAGDPAGRAPLPGAPAARKSWGRSAN